MKRQLAMVFLMILALPLLAAGPRQEQWKKVKENMDKGLPKSAIEQLEPMIQAALQDKAYAEAIKAIGQKIALEGNVQGNKPEEKITRLQAEIAKAPEPMQPVMEAILANWYWHYFQHNRWRFMQRTATDQQPGEDFTTWDLPRIFAEIDKRFAKALTHTETLQKTPIAQYDELLVKGNMPDAYRPTLYDFLAYNALEFYLSGEQAAAKPQDAFELAATGPIFGPVTEFMAWKIEATDVDSSVLRAVQLYQDLLKFHQHDQDQGAFLDADLARLVYGYNKAFGEDKQARYKTALQRFVDKWGDHEISARARFHGAQVLHDEGDLVAARKLAEQGWQAFPNSVGGRMCFNLIQQIEAKSLRIGTERVWAEPWPTIQIHYRNMTKVHLRIVPWNFQERLKSRNWQPEELDHNERKALLGRKADLAWDADLPATADYQERVAELPAPQDLKPGFYYLVASAEPSFGEQNNVVHHTAFWRSQLAIVVRSRGGDAALEGFVLDATTGAPLPETQVRPFAQNNQAQWEALPAVQTDINGLFRLRPPPQRNLLVYAQARDQALATHHGYSVYPQDQTPQPDTQTVFFTDRSLYRPGQTIQYKGISIRVDQRNDTYNVLPNVGLTVIFADVNGTEIARQQLKTNDYGSCSGSFTAPRDRLMGRMSIRVEGQPHGETQVTVEEYKRPKFQVAFEAPQTAAKLNDAVKLKATATAYTGAAIDGAKVRWRVVRQVRFPEWWFWRCWWCPPRPEQSQEIAHGTATTGVDGSFPVEFTAKPDMTVSAKDEPTFQFTVYADVTDTAGETRSAQRVINVGYTALKALLSTEPWLAKDKPVSVTIRTTTLDGEPQRAEGSLKIYRLRQPEKVHRAQLPGHEFPHWRFAVKKGAEPQPDPANPASWALAEMVAERGFTTDANGTVSYPFDLPEGMYRATLETQDRFQKKVTAELPIRVLDPAAKQLGIRIPHVFDGPQWVLQPGQEFQALWGTGYDRGRAYVEIEHRGKILQGYWTAAEATQATVKQEVTEAMRGGFTVRVTMVRENRAYLESRRVDVPWTNKNLKLKWEHFVSKLQPAQKETWTAVITGPDAKQAVAEMVAALYDQSLDAYLPHDWVQQFGVFRQDYSNLNSQFENAVKWLEHLHGQWRTDQRDTSITYRTFPPEVIANLWGFQHFANKGRQARGMGLVEAESQMALEAPMATAGAPPPAPSMALDRLEAPALRANAMAETKSEGGAADQQRDPGGAAGEPGQPPAPQPDLSKVAARKNLNETAFFFPHLIAQKDGEVKLEFTMPEALTQWKFLGFAHDAQLRAGYLQDSVVTAKDLMVQPNPPRFLREGDVLEFTVKVTNQSAARQTGQVRLALADARTGQSVDAALGNTAVDQAFEIPSKESRSYSWKLRVPDGMGFLSYKAVGATGRLSDGEEGFLPVLPRRILVTESLPLPIRGPDTKQYRFTKLVESGKSDTLRHQSLTVQMVSNPAWYAVMALPYLMEYPYECSEQVFNRLYANALARHIANQDPKIRRVFDQWKGTPAVDSPLEKNQDLKAVLLEETPWVRQAEAESQARKNVGILFDENRLNDETARLLKKLSEMQRPDGLWPWFPGGPGNEYMTLYITTGFGRMRHLSVDLSVEPAVKSLAALDTWIDSTYRDILRHGKPDENHLSSTIALYLYGRSFFLKDQPIPATAKEAVDYFLGQARKYWLQLAIRQSQAHLAIALNRFGDKAAAQGILHSLKERSVSDEELGMFWRDLELSWWWFRAPIETQALMIEAFDEVLADAKSVEDCKVWLLKQKQTQDWKTTKATADAVYALLLRGTDLLASTELVQVTLANQPLKPAKVEPGTGFYEQRFAGSEVKPELGEVTVKKVDPGVAWGSVHWQYLEDVAKVTPHEGTPLKLQKQLYRKETTKKGPVLTAVQGPVQIGDELVVRVTLRTDRDLEYVHLKDQRPSGSEPVNVLSQYKYQDGLAYYESTRDTASHFFIDYLPKGTYVFEYSVRVQHKGQYQSGVAEIQCLYAPEFNSHSESLLLEAS